MMSSARIFLLLGLGSAAVIALLARSEQVRPGEEPAIRRVGTLRTPRAAHTATTLRSGQVLIAGGMTSGGGGIATVEVFDPGNNSMRELGPMTARRTGHTATLLRDGRVLIAGGYDGDYLSSVELFDPQTRRFVRAGRLMEGRSGHTASLLPDGRVLLIGGVGQGWTFLRSAEVYDPSTRRSQQVGSMASPRESHTATLLIDGRVLVVGGHSGRRPAQQVYSSAEVFDPRTGRFESSGNLVIARHKHDAVRLADGRVLIIAGADRSDRVHYATTEVYDPAKRTFASGPSMQNTRYKIAGTSIRLSDGDVLVTSGARSAEILDQQSFSFQAIPGRLPAAYNFATAAALPGGDVMIAGGYDDANMNTAGVWRFHRAR